MLVGLSLFLVVALARESVRKKPQSGEMFIVRDRFPILSFLRIEQNAPHFVQFVRLRTEESLWAINISCLTPLFQTDSLSDG